MKIRIVKDAKSKNRNNEPCEVEFDATITRISNYRIPDMGDAWETKKDDGSTLVRERPLVTARRYHEKGLLSYWQNRDEFFYKYSHDVGWNGIFGIVSSVQPCARGGMTEIRVSYDVEYPHTESSGTVVGVSLCSLDDNFNYKIGRTLAYAYSLHGQAKLLGYNRSNKFWANIMRNMLGDDTHHGICLFRDLFQAEMLSSGVQINIDNGNVDLT